MHTETAQHAESPARPRRSSRFTEVYSPGAFIGAGTRYFLGRSFMFWQDGTRALGVALWGRPVEADIDELIPFLDLAAAPRFKDHANIIDARLLEAADVLAFSRLLAYLVDRRHVFGPNVRRQAILQPGGLTGAVVSGTFQVARLPYTFETFDAVAAPAFEWCGLGDLTASYEAWLEEATDVPAVVRQVRAALREDNRLELHALAKKLCTSARTLQRRLEDAGTSIREQRDLQLNLHVEHLLSGTDLDLEAVARSVGLSSASHLVRRFRESHGTTPGEWRARRQKQVEAAL
ncbi:MAG: helix-turn-helix transcriptional regulator [Myxococcaceae bacterium]|nr:helix-turn-helix transcriptional regulator [Myxococcaceae bacterium]